MIGLPICKVEGRDISLCGGQAYDRNAYMQGRRKSVKLSQFTDLYILSIFVYTMLEADQPFERYAWHVREIVTLYFKEKT